MTRILERIFKKSIMSWILNFWLSLSLSEEKNLENLGNFENSLEPFFSLLDLGIFHKYGNEMLLHHKEHFCPTISNIPSFDLVFI